MKPKTQQAILRALAQMFSDLEKWLKGRGVSETKIHFLYVKAIAERGMFAQIIKDLTVTVFPLAAKVDVDPTTIISELRRAKSGEYASWLLNQPEPDPEDLREFLTQAKNALPKLKEHLLGAAKLGPRYKAGGRPSELEDPKTREEIRAKIKERRKPGISLEELFESVAREYEAEHSAHRHKISSATIKRIWYEREESGRVEEGGSD